MRRGPVVVLGLCGALWGWAAVEAREPPAPAFDARVAFAESPVIRARDAALLLSGQDGGALDVELLTSGPEGGLIGVTVRFEAAALPAQVVLYVLRGREVVASGTHRIETASGGSRGGLDDLRVVFQTTLEAPAGSERIRLLVRSAEEIALRTARISPAGGLEGTLPSMPGSPEPRLALEAAPKRSRTSPEDSPDSVAQEGLGVEDDPPVGAQVEAVLRRLLSRADSAALEALEIELAEARPKEVLSLLDAVYRRIEASLGPTHPDAAWALAVVHMERAWSHGEAGRGALARTAAEQAIVAIEGYARSQGDAASRARAAQVLGVLAGRRLTVGRAAAAEPLFRRALEWHGDDAVARRGLASLLEKTGRFEEAAEMLEPWAGASRSEDDDEVRLRWALCRLRHRPKDRPASRELHRLSAEGRPRWVAALATEERARRLVRQGELSEALRLVEDRHRRWPEFQGLTVQLARLLDVGGRPAAARQLLDDLDRAEASGSEAPRTRYNRWPLEAWSASRRELAEAARAHRPALARALSGETPQEAS